MNHPLYGIDEPRRVRGIHLNGVFVSDLERGVQQRGALIGIKPHQLRQVCSLALGAGRVDGVACQVCRNEGELPLCSIHDSRQSSLTKGCVFCRWSLASSFFSG